MSPAAPILLVKKPLAAAELSRLVGHPFPDMVKFVVDVERKIAAVGGELHADAEEILIEDGSRQIALWGGNYFPGRGEGECIVFNSLINVRPAAGNRSLTVEDPVLRDRIREVVFVLIGRGEPLA
jgi:hypothetical protein